MNRCSTVVTPVRTATVTRTGAILPKPEKTSFGLLRVLGVVIPFLYLGTQISKIFAALLEEHESFVPEDDDDDDGQQRRATYRDQRKPQMMNWF